jgi:hypothetical protein
MTLICTLSMSQQTMKPKLICMRYIFHPFSTVSCFRQLVSRDKISHYFDRLICQMSYYDAKIAWQIYALFIEFYYALFLFLCFKDMHYNTMIRTFCIMKKMTFSAFHYLNLSTPTSYDSHTKTLQKYKLFDLEVKGQGNNVVMMVHDIPSDDYTPIYQISLT